VTIHQAEAKPLLEIAKEINKKVGAVKNHSDRTYKKMKSIVSLLPSCFTGILLDLSSFLQYSLNLWSPLLGTPKDPLGSIQITNIGSIGLDFAFAPLVPYSRVPMVIAVGAIKDQVVAKDGKAVVVPMLRLCVTFDHRLIDGAHAAKLAKVAEAIFCAPDKELGAIDTFSQAN
jgi:pyruvate dehydrogenase E2 component (dihydrolipoamide acetyltransferase)